jgi:hypothetical protein
MFTTRKLPTLLVLLLSLEAVIYLWALATTEPEFVFDKCARNSGRVSSLINLMILLMLGHVGFERIRGVASRWDALRVLITLFAVGHVVHLAFVALNFHHHGLVLSMVEQLHGTITFVFLLAAPVALWSVREPKPWWNILLIIHLINVSFFIMKTFYSKITPDRPAYHNQLGIVVTSAAIVYVLYRAARQLRQPTLEAVRPT